VPIAAQNRTGVLIDASCVVLTFPAIRWKRCRGRFLSSGQPYNTREPFQLFSAADAVNSVYTHRRSLTPEVALTGGAIREDLSDSRVNCAV
jgi:hypothetical protein